MQLTPYKSDVELWERLLQHDSQYDEGHDDAAKPAEERAYGPTKVRTASKTHD
jgi:hypothetical protein